MTSGAVSGLDTSEVSNPARSGEYEFTHEENQVIGSCAHRARIFGILCAITGALQLVAAVVSVAGLIDATALFFLLPSGAFNVVLGVLLTRVSTSLTLVVTTAGSDVSLMMKALSNLGQAFWIQIIAAILFIILLATVMVSVVLVSRLGAG